MGCILKSVVNVSDPAAAFAGVLAQSIAFPSIGKSPIRRLPSRGNHSPYTTFDNCFPWRSAWHTPPDWSPQTHPCFLACGVGCVGAAPSTHQDPGLVTSRPQARRLPLAPVVPQKTVSSLPCPIVDCAQMPWLPEGSCFPTAHGRGVARLHHPVGGPLSWGEVGTNQTRWFSTIFPPRLPLHPNWWLTLSQKLCGHQRAAGLA